MRYNKNYEAWCKERAESNADAAGEERSRSDAAGEEGSERGVDAAGEAERVCSGAESLRDEVAERKDKVQRQSAKTECKDRVQLC